jgi:hypothetical protein
VTIAKAIAKASACFIMVGLMFLFPTLNLGKGAGAVCDPRHTYAT